MSRLHNLDQLYARLRASLGAELESFQKAVQDLSAQDLELVKAISSVQDAFVVLATMGERKGLWTEEELMQLTAEVFAAQQSSQQSPQLALSQDVTDEPQVTIFGG